MILTYKIKHNRDLCKGSTDTPKEATAIGVPTLEPTVF